MSEERQVKNREALDGMLFPLACQCGRPSFMGENSDPRCATCIFEQDGPKWREQKERRDRELEASDG